MCVSERWLVTGEKIKVLEGFRHRTNRRIMGITATHGAGWEWQYPPVVAALEAVGLQPIRKYITRRQATISEKVAFCPIYELCAKAEQMPKMIWMMRWWDQDVVNEPEE